MYAEYNRTAAIGSPQSERVMQAAVRFEGRNKLCFWSWGPWSASKYYNIAYPRKAQP